MVLTIVCCLGALSGAITQWMGIHALFGLFLAGIMAGGTPALSERTRHVIEQMVHAVFVPVFFASIGLQVDFVGRFRWLPVLVLTVVGVGGRYYGAWVGARMTRLSRWDRVSIAIAHTPGGSMAMVVGLIAFEFGVITQEILVAIVFSSLLSSLLLGPWLAWSIRRRGGINLLDVLEREAICLDMASEQRWDVIRTLSDALARLPGMAPAETIAREVRLREEAAGTAVGQEMAFPHARMDGLDRAVVAFGRETGGIEWNAPDGVPVHLVFLILTPKTQDETQVQILSALARGLASEDLRRRLRETSDSDAAWAILREAAAKAATQTE